MAAGSYPEPRPPTAQADATIRVLAAVVRRGDRYLLCRRPAGKRHGGCWEFPGGKVDPGETSLAAVRRELREELGVEVAVVGPPRFERRDPGSPFLLEFVDVEIRGEPVPTEHEEVRWVAVEDMAALPLAPVDRVFVEEVLEPLARRTRGT